MKDQIAVDIREQDGEKLPDTLVNKHSARDITLLFGLYASSRTSFLSARSNFINFLKTGSGGWLNINVPELNKIFRVYVKDFPEWDQIAFDDALSFGQFQVTFREPAPIF